MDFQSLNFMQVHSQLFEWAIAEVRDVNCNIFSCGNDFGKIGISLFKKKV